MQDHDQPADSGPPIQPPDSGTGTPRTIQRSAEDGPTAVIEIRGPQRNTHTTVRLTAMGKWGVTTLSFAALALITAALTIAKSMRMTQDPDSRLELLILKMIALPFSIIGTVMSCCFMAVCRPRHQLRGVKCGGLLRKSNNNDNDGYMSDRSDSSDSSNSGMY